MGDARSFGICPAIDLGDAVVAEPDVANAVLRRGVDGGELAGDGDRQLEVDPAIPQRRQPSVRPRPTRSSSRSSGSGKMLGPMTRRERRLIRQIPAIAARWHGAVEGVVRPLVVVVAAPDVEPGLRGAKIRKAATL